MAVEQQDPGTRILSFPQCLLAVVLMIQLNDTFNLAWGPESVGALLAGKQCKQLSIWLGFWPPQFWQAPSYALIC